MKEQLFDVIEQLNELVQETHKFTATRKAPPTKRWQGLALNSRRSRWNALTIMHVINSTMLAKSTRRT